MSQEKRLAGQLMRRVAIVGPAGAGKTTLARRLGRVTGLPVIHLDAEYWQPGWIEPERGEWERRARALAARDAWIIDGNYCRTIDARLRACDAVVLLEVPRWLCLQRVIRRWWAHRGTTRPDMGPRCPEKLDWEFVMWVWNFPGRARRELLANIQRCAADRPIHVLRTRREIDAFVAGAAPI